MEAFLDFLFRNPDGPATANMLMLGTVVGGSGLALLGPLERWMAVLFPARPRLAKSIANVGMGAVFVGSLAFGSHTSSLVPAYTALELRPDMCRNQGAKELVVFIHGWNGDPKETWRKFPELLCKDRRFKNVDTLSIDYPTYVARRNLTLIETAAWIDDRLNSGNYYRRYDRIFILAHSMGGVVGKKIVLFRQLAGEFNDKIKAVVAIATPFDGAHLAALSASLGLGGIARVKDLAVGSEILGQVALDWTRLGPKPALHCLASNQDGVVTVDSATRDCPVSSRVPKFGHTELVKPDDRCDDRYLIPTMWLAADMGVSGNWLCQEL